MICLRLRVPAGEHVHLSCLGVAIEGLVLTTVVICGPCGGFLLPVWWLEDQKKQISLCQELCTGMLDKGKSAPGGGTPETLVYCITSLCVTCVCTV